MPMTPAAAETSPAMGSEGRPHKTPLAPDPPRFWVTPPSENGAPEQNSPVVHEALHFDLGNGIGRYPGIHPAREN